jgi:cysteine desulfurase
MEDDMREVYADHAATTPPAPEVVEAIRPYLAGGFGNASSVHRRGEAARDAIETARADVAALLEATPEEIVFTASGSESNNLALMGVLEAAPPGRDRLIVSAIEHPSVLETARHAASSGYRLTVVPVDRRGALDMDALNAALGDDVALVSVMAVNNEVGTIQPVFEVARVAHACGALVHTDAVQAAGKQSLQVQKCGADLLSIAAHKFYGVAGAGALYVKRRTRVVPRIHGGHQERGRRAGTENLPAIVGMGAAARMAMAGDAEAAAMGRRLAVEMPAAVDGCRFNGDPQQRVGSIANLCFSGVDGEALLHELDREGVVVSTGSACSAAEPGPSHVLVAMGLSPEDAHASVRFSFGRANRAADVDRILSVVPPVIRRLRALNEPVVGKGA